MAYNPAMYQTYGNMYSGYGQMMQPQQPQYSQTQNSSAYQTQTVPTGIQWVDGEVGAKAFQMPSGWPANTPMPLWDTNDTIIYLKSTNPMGMPNPLQRIHYKMDQQAQQPQGQNYEKLMSGDEKHDGMDNYVKKEDLEQMKRELMESISNMQSSTGTVRKTAKGETA